MLMSSYVRPQYREDFKIALVCALPLEYDAVTLSFDEFWDEDEDRFGKATGDPNTYTTGRIGRHNVVLVLLSDMGKVSAASTAASLRSSYNGLKVAVLVGICGGVPSTGPGFELLLGDVIISNTVVQYDLGKQHPGRFSHKDTIEDKVTRPNQDIRSLLAVLQTEIGLDRLQRRATQVLSCIQQRAVTTTRRTQYDRPEEDLLFEPGYPHIHKDQKSCGCSDTGPCVVASYASCEELRCDYRHLVPRGHIQTRIRDDLGSQELQVYVGRVASGDTVMKSGKHRDKIAKEHSIIAFEMEGAGIGDGLPCVVVKGVCDYADSHKNKKWQPFAAAAAAAVSKALLERYIQGDRQADKANTLPPRPNTPNNFAQHGSGHQFNNLGSGTQNVNTGSGRLRAVGSILSTE